MLPDRDTTAKRANKRQIPAAPNVSAVLPSNLPTSMPVAQQAYICEYIFCLPLAATPLSIETQSEQVNQFQPFWKILASAFGRVGLGAVDC